MITLHYTVPGRSLAADDSLKEKTWKVGDESLCSQLDEADLQVISLVAEGDELQYIDNVFKNIPISPYRKKVCVWRGELARFIFDNL